VPRPRVWVRGYRSFEEERAVTGAGMSVGHLQRGAFKEGGQPRGGEAVLCDPARARVQIGNHICTHGR